jgi:hypothetical protein
VNKKDSLSSGVDSRKTALSDKDAFFSKVAELIENAKAHVGRTADKTMAVTYFLVGQMIIEQEQDGEVRAKYGTGVIPELSVYLTEKLGRGYSETNLKSMRKFYEVYASEIRQTLSAELTSTIGQDQIRQTMSAELNTAYFL